MLLEVSYLMLTLISPPSLSRVVASIPLALLICTVPDSRLLVLSVSPHPCAPLSDHLALPSLKNQPPPRHPPTAGP